MKLSEIQEWNATWDKEEWAKHSVEISSAFGDAVKMLEAVKALSDRRRAEGIAPVNPFCDDIDAILEGP